LFLQPAARRPGLRVSLEMTSRHTQGPQLTRIVRNDKQAPIATFLAPAAAQGRQLSLEMTSRHPVNKGFQSITNSYIMRPWAQTAGCFLEMTSKQLSTGYSQSVVSYPQVTAE